MADKQLTGRHVLIITASAFAIIIAVNLVMAYKAVSTFPGVEVKNSYVASQEFDSRRAAQEQLGWQITTEYAFGLLTINFTDANGRAVSPDDFSVLIGRTTEAADDVQPAFTGYDGKYSAPVDLDRGKWMMRVTATADDGTQFQQRLELFIKG